MIHTVVKGECLSSIADKAGFTWQQLWNDDNNKDLRDKRGDPNVLYPGDQVFIPDDGRPATPISLDGDPTTIVRRKAGCFGLELRILDAEGEPQKDADYTLTPDGGDAITGKTDSDGILKQELPMSVQKATLDVGDLHFDLDIGHLTPLDNTGDDISGVQARLQNLGYDPGDIDGKLSDATVAALNSFQQDEKIDVTGKVDDATKARLKARYGC